jgi:hypothetical protein
MVEKERKPLQTVGLIIFFIGFLIGVLLLGLSVIGDFESNQFYPSIIGDRFFKSLDCPVMMAESEVGTVTATIKNPIDSKVTPTVWIHISEGNTTLLREDRVNLTLQPGESQSIQWTITKDDAAYGYWVLVKIFVYSQYPLPSTHGSCGVFIADFKGLTGKQVHILSMATSGVLMVVGGGMWFLSSRPLRGKTTLNMRRALIIMGAAVSGGVITTLIGSQLWILSGVILIPCLLLILVFLLGSI